MIESLEDRIAPALLAGNVLTYTDIDGDLVKITFSHATMVAGDFTFSTGSVNGTTATPQSLTTLKLTGHEGAGFVLKATPQNGQGDSHANIGSIQSTTTDLGAISIDGDLGAGVFTPSAFGKAALKSLSVLSLGKGNAASGSTLQITGLGSLTVKTDIGNVGVTLESSSVVTSSVNVGGDLIGNSFFSSGSLTAQVAVLSVKIGGSVIGGEEVSTGQLNLDGTHLQKLSIGGSIIGGTGQFTGIVEAGGNAKTVISIGGDILGNSSSTIGDNGEFYAAAAASIKIGGSVIGATSTNTGTVTIGGNTGSLSIGHAVVGADNPKSSGSISGTGYVHVTGNLGTLTVGGGLFAGKTLSGGTLSEDGEIAVSGVIGKATLGSIVGNENTLAYLVAGADGTTGAASAIKSLTVRHSVVSASILAGYDGDFTQKNIDSGFGSINIGGNLSGSFITAGAAKGPDGIPGTTDDTFSSAVAKINSVKIGADFTGLADDAGKTFYIFGSIIEKAQIGKATYTHADLVAPGLEFHGIGLATIDSSF